MDIDKLHLPWYADWRDPWKVRNCQRFIVAEFNSIEDAAACIEAVNAYAIHDLIVATTGSPDTAQPASKLSPTPLDICPFCGADGCMWDCPESKDVASNGSSQ